MFLIAFVTLLFMTAVKLKSQQVSQDTTSTLVLLNTLTGLSISTLFMNLGALAGAVLLLTSLLKKWFNSNGTITIILSAIVSFGLSTFGYFIGLGIFAGLSWIYILIYGTAAMLSANGLSSWAVISAVLTFLKLKVPAEK
jgi:hypothetical protein